MRFLAAVVGLAFGPLPSSSQAQIAVVVNRRNSVENLTAEQLRRLYLGSSTTFADGTRAILVESPAVRVAFYSQLLGMTDAQFKRHWMGLVFAGENANPPRELTTAPDLRRFVTEQSGAIAFVALADVDASVKVVSIDGAKPTDANYPLRDARRGAQRPPRP
jgi:ABC-type phosphate transport system substrate-binding protein